MLMLCHTRQDTLAKIAVFDTLQMVLMMVSLSLGRYSRVGLVAGPQAPMQRDAS